MPEEKNKACHPLVAKRAGKIRTSNQNLLVGACVRAPPPSSPELFTHCKVQTSEQLDCWDSVAKRNS
jgi:hypothetical protein